MHKNKILNRFTAAMFYTVSILVLIQIQAAGQAFVTRTVSQGGSIAQPTTLAVGPDGRLFVGQRNGLIHVVNINSGCGVSTQLISSAFSGRLVTGITFAPSGDLYVSHSDGLVDSNAVNTSSGMISRLVAPGYTTRIDVVGGLPRSKSDHAPNGMTFGPGGFLYLAIGGFTNAGLRSAHFFYEEETYFSAAILKIDVSWGGVYVFASGFRNPYDIVYHSNTKFYATDNGTNAMIGNKPNTGCDLNQLGEEPGRTNDELNLIVEGGYYGHPNIARGQCTFGGGTGPIASLPSSVQGLAEYTSGRVPSFLGNLFAANFTLGQVLRIQLTPDGFGVASVSTYATGLSNPLDVAVSPDGRIFVAEYGANRITEIVPLVSPNSLGYNAVPDFTGPDNFLDGRRRADIADHYVNGHFWIRRNNGNGTFVAPGGASWAEGDSAPPNADWQVLVGDFTGDGYGDYVDRSRISGDFWVHDNLRTGGTSAFDPAGAPDWASGTSVTGADWEVLAGDVDGDGRADIIEHNLVTGQLRFLHNGGPGAGTFTCVGSSVFRTPVGPDWRLLVADFTGDGWADVADFHIPSGHFWIHRNVGGYQFDAANWGEGNGNIDPSAPGRWTTIVGDFTGDGYADFADVQRDSGEFWVHENLRTGGVSAFDPVGPPDWGYGLYTPWNTFSIFGLPVTFRAIP